MTTDANTKQVNSKWWCKTGMVCGSWLRSWISRRRSKLQGLHKSWRTRLWTLHI